MKSRNASSTPTPNASLACSSTGTLPCAIFAIDVEPSPLREQLTKPHRQECLCYSEVTVSSPIRRVVTGKDATGKAIAMIDAVATTVLRREELGVTNTLLWVTDSTPADLSNQEDMSNMKIGVVAPPGGTIFRVVEFAP